MTSAPYQSWLEGFLARHGAVAGTVHLRNGDELELVAAVNIPPTVIEATRRIPRGRGMAGLAFERREPVTTCNLQTDRTGDVRPGARAVAAQAAVALPVQDADGQVRATLGVAFAGERELSQAEIAALAQAAQSLPART